MFGEEESLERKTIRDLPNEILLAIFSYLQTHDIKYSISNVCVQWSNLAKDKKLWRHLVFKTTSKTTKTFGWKSWFSTLRFLQSTPELRNVIVSQGHSGEEISEILKYLNDHCPDLRHMEFEDDVAAMVNLFKGMDNIFERVESLVLNLGFSQSGVFKILSQFKNLKSLTFTGFNLESAGFGNFIRNCPTLQSFYVSKIDFTKYNFNDICAVKDQFVNLSLKLNNLDEKHVKQLELFSKLQTIGIADGNASPSKLLIIANFKCLTSLHLMEAATSPVLTSTTLSNFFRDGWFHNLKELKLHNSRIDDDVAAEIRRKCVNLVYLEVMTYQKTVSSLSKKALLHFLHCERLQYLEIVFDNSEETDWIYRRIRHIRHDCNDYEDCPLGLETMLTAWDEILIPVD